MSKKKKRFGCGLAFLGAAAVLVFGAGIVCRNIGLQRMQTSLQEESGDRQELQPFSLSAYTLFQAENVVTHFTLENGVLSGQVMTETANMPENARLPELFSTHTILAVRPENRDTINRTGRFSGNTAESESSDFLVMREIQLPDDTCLRLHMADYQSETPGRVAAYPNMVSGMDWAFADTLPEQYAGWAEEDTISWQGSWFLNLGGKDLYYQPGVWRVTESLTEKERDALPADGTVQYGENTVPVLCKSTEYGSVQLFYQPQNVDTVLRLTRVGEYLGVLYQDTDGDIRFDLVDDSARCIQQATIREKAETGFSAYNVNTQNQDQAAFTLWQPEADVPTQITLVRLDETGTLDVVSLPGSMRQDGGGLAGTQVLQLSPDGQKLLSVGMEEVPVEVHRNSWEAENAIYYTGYRVNVYDLTRQAVTYSGLLNTGISNNWGSYLKQSNFLYYGLAGELLSMNRDYYTIFPQQVQEG